MSTLAPTGRGEQKQQAKLAVEKLTVQLECDRQMVRLITFASPFLSKKHFLWALHQIDMCDPQIKEFRKHCQVTSSCSGLKLLRHLRKSDRDIIGSGYPIFPEGVSHLRAVTACLHTLKV